MLTNRLSTSVELQDMGKYRSDWSGIFSPVYNDSLINQYIQGQFLEGADCYVKNFQSLPYWKHLIQSAQQYFLDDISESPIILDLGSGAGNTIFPLMDLYPNSVVVASDLSLPLLKSLKSFWEKEYPQHKCYVLQLNAEEIIFDENQFDLVVGGAILHHLFSPKKTLNSCYKVLKKNGTALFFEPFEMGNLIIAMILKNILILDLVKEDKIPVGIVNLFKMLCNDFDVRKGIDKTGDIFKKIDDKWLFTKSYFENTAKEEGFREVIIYPIHESKNQFSNQIQTYLRLGLNEEETLPFWAESYIHEMDHYFSEELQKELIIEGAILLRK